MKAGGVTRDNLSINSRAGDTECIGWGGDLAFFAWGDTHIGYLQQSVTEDFRAGIIEQMNALPGLPYPDATDGCVAEPDFVMHCGDFVDGSLNGDEELEIYRQFISRLRFPYHETQGNHDLDSPSRTYMTEKYGGDCHEFLINGVQCISLSAEYDEAEKSTIGAGPLAFLEETLGKVKNDVPVIIFTHSPLREQTNGDEVAEALSGHRIALAIAAHKHRPEFYKWHGINCIDLGHCRNHPIDPEYGRSVTVVRMTGNTVSALPWRWDLRDWDRQQRWGNNPIPESEQRFRMRAEF